MSRRSKREQPHDPDWKPRIVDTETLDEVLARLPTEPGVYLIRDRQGELVYVGKAANLRSRVRQYFNGTDTRMFVPLLAKLVGDITTTVVTNDKEALLLENNLIKEHRPRFNVKLRDDANYLVLRLDRKSSWPRLELVRQVAHDGAWYFGPYHSARAVRSALRVVNRHFQLRTCSDFVLSHRTRPCLQYQIARCPGPCVYDVDKASYQDQVGDVRLFLSGRHSELLDSLTARMHQAAEALDFETAARIRDQLSAVDSVLQAQQIVGTSDIDQDAFGMYREGGQVEFVVLQVRQGKVMQTQSYSAKGMELPDAEVLGSFVNAYYDKAAFIPDEVVLPFALHDDDFAPLGEWLRDRKGRKCTVCVPERGERKKLVALANRNASSSFTSRRDRREDSEITLTRLQQRLDLSRLPRVIECYDVSHIQGSDTVASMVVFVDGAPEKSRYRSFRIKGISTDNDEPSLRQGTRQNDDFASMYEVLGRRLRRALQTGDADDEAWALPDLMVIDGGKGQLAQVIAAMADLGIAAGAEGCDVVALAKERKDALGHGRAALEQLRGLRDNADGRPNHSAAHETGTYQPDDDVDDRVDGEQAATTTTHMPGQRWAEAVVEQIRQDSDDSGETYAVRPERVFTPGRKDPVILRPGSSERYLMERVRDEAHRFAITHHRKRRGKRSLASALDDIEGVGPAIKRALVTHFGSVAAIRNASPEDLCHVRGVGPALAERIRNALTSGN